MGVFGGVGNKIAGSGSTPTVVLGTGVSSQGATIAIQGTNAACTITITTGLNVTTGGDLFTLTLADGVTFTTVVRPTLTAYNLTTANMSTSVYPANMTSNSFTVKCGTVSIAASSTLIITCHIIGD